MEIIKLTESDLHAIISSVAEQIIKEEDFNSDHYSDDMFDDAGNNAENEEF